jgi:hypothetical protein
MDPLIQQAMLQPAALNAVFKHTLGFSSSSFLAIHPEAISTRAGKHHWLNSEKFSTCP